MANTYILTTPELNMFTNKPFRLRWIPISNVLTKALPIGEVNPVTISSYNKKTPWAKHGMTINLQHKSNSFYLLPANKNAIWNSNSLFFKKKKNCMREHPEHPIRIKYISITVLAIKIHRKGNKKWKVRQDQKQTKIQIVKDNVTHSELWSTNIQSLSII